MNGAILARLCGLAIAAGLAPAGTPRMPMPIQFENSAEFRWLGKTVLAARLLDDMSDPARWVFEGQGKLTALARTGPRGVPALRVDVTMYRDAPAPTRNGLAAVNLRRPFPGEDWSAYNRISFWIRPELSGFPMLPIVVVLRNEGTVKVPDVYRREGVHYVTVQDRKWQRVVWEIAPLARDRVTSLEFGYWVNKRLAAPGDAVAFEIAALELERVEPDHYEGWQAAPGAIVFSHTGYSSGASKTALAADLPAARFELIRLDNNVQGEVVLSKPVEERRTRLGRFQVLDFSEIQAPGRYVIQAGSRRTRPFRIAPDVWKGTIWKVINFFFCERCGYPVPGMHEVCHRDWQAALGDKRIVINGGWHDAGDLSQGLVNTGEAVYAMFALADRFQRTGKDPELLARLLEEARWGLDWVLKARFEGGYRIGFAGMNLWTNGILGDADDRIAEARNNPTVNYIAAAAEAIAARLLKGCDPELAARSLRAAEDDWRWAIAGEETPETRSTLAYAATPMELAAMGALASAELYQVTGDLLYAEKAFELARAVLQSQQRSFLGSEFPLSGFFYTGPDKKTIFHQFHRANDQAPVTALVKLCELFPEHEQWMEWYAAVTLYSEYLKRAALSTEPYAVLPAYVYKDTEYLEVPETGGPYQATREDYREQVLRGMPMGQGYYLKAFPVWFARRGNYGVLLSQTKALAAAARLRRDPAAADLAERQLQWIVGRNPFGQSTMYGEGYDWTQLYSVSSGDMVGALPVGIQTRGNGDAPYWPAQNCYVYKEVWVHPAARWLWIMEELAGPGASQAPARAAPADAVRPGAWHALDFKLAATTEETGLVTIRLTASGEGRHEFTLRAWNLDLVRPARVLALRPGAPGEVIWKARLISPDAPWVAVAFPDGDLARRKELVGWAPRFDLRSGQNPGKDPRSRRTVRTQSEMH